MNLCMFKKNKYLFFVVASYPTQCTRPWTRIQQPAWRIWHLPKVPMNRQSKGISSARKMTKCGRIAICFNVKFQTLVPDSPNASSTIYLAVSILVLFIYFGFVYLKIYFNHFVGVREEYLNFI